MRLDQGTRLFFAVIQVVERAASYGKGGSVSENQTYKQLSSATELFDIVVPLTRRFI